MAIEQFKKGEVLTAAKMNTIRDAVNQAQTDITSLQTNSATKSELSAATTGSFYGYAATAENLPTGGSNGYAYVGTAAPYAIYNCIDGAWTNSGSTLTNPVIEAVQDSSNLIHLSANGTEVTDNIATPEFIDDRLTEIETHLSGLIFDVSEANGGTSYESLSGALSVANDVLLPEQKKGGMSIKFVQSTDNKYVQYRYMETVTTAATFANVANWQGIDNEPTVGSDNLVKSGGVADNLGYTTESPDYIRLIIDKKNHLLFGIKINGDVEWGKGVPTPIKNYINQKIDELGLDKVNDIVEFIDNLEVEGKTLAELLGEKANKEEVNQALDNKVDKENGKGLIDTQYVEECEHEELIQAFTDNKGRVLQGIKVDGKPYFPHNEMMEVGDIPGYNHVVLDKGNKIVEGIDEEGRHVFNAGVEISQLKTESGIESSDWIDVKTDSKDRILEGINKDGEKHISKFDKSTQDLIKSFAGGGAVIGGNYIKIPVFDSNFASPVPVEITGTKGADDAKYVFDLPLSNDAFNIRFKFRITENLLNENKSAVIAKLGSTDAIVATPVGLSQLVTTATYNDEPKNCHWGTLAGGIKLNNSEVNRVGIQFGKQNIGSFAFYVKYIGNEDEACVENDGSRFIVKAGNNVTNYPFTEYETVYALYNALRSRNDLEVSYNEIENRLCTELAIFDECKIKGLFYSGVNEDTTIQEYVDNAPFFVPYAVSDEWHRVEIVKIANTIYVLCDGVQKTIVADANTLTLGGECGVLFKDFEVHTNSAYDAEISGGIVISSMNPYILIHEGHGIDKVPTGDGVQTDDMATTVDRLQYVYSLALSKGYIPVSIEDIADYYAGIKELPKRCFTVIFDDYRFVNCMDVENRAVFTRLGIKPVLAIITDREVSITHNGETIELAKAVDICRMNHFSLVSHTRNHRRVVATKPSTYMQEFVNDIYSADIKGIDGRIIVYPYGTSDSYEHDTLKWLGVRLGISVYEGATPRYNVYNRNRYRLVRQEIGLRMNISDILSHIL